MLSRLLVSPGLLAEIVFDFLLHPEPILIGGSLLEFSLTRLFVVQRRKRLQNEAHEWNNYDVIKLDNLNNMRR